jgi:RNA polymerase sigma-70 factor (ECF subfamily)
MLGSPGEADDAVQEAWIRLSRSGADDVENLGGWLTTVVSRVCLDMLRSRTARREELLDTPVHETTPTPAEGFDPEHEALLADSMGPALLVVLETLARADEAGVKAGAAAEVRGAAAVAETFAGRAQAAQPALVDGTVGLAWAPGGRPKAVFDFMISNGRIVAIDLILDPEVLDALDLELLAD